MIQLLCRLDSIPLLEQFIGGVVTAHYDGSENEALVAAASRLGATNASHLFGRLARENMRGYPSACVQLLATLIRARRPATRRGARRCATRRRYRRGAGPASKPAAPDHGEWWRVRARLVDGAMVAN
jgi:hypothetical protein